MITSPATHAFDYSLEGLDCEGVMVSGGDDAPTVLVFHGMEGRSDAQVEFCSRLADVGYQAVAVDVSASSPASGGYIVRPRTANV